MKSSFASCLFLIAGCVMLSPAARAQEKPLTAAETEALVKKVIAENPELIIKSVESYQIKQQAASVSKAAQNIIALQNDLTNNPHSPSAGNPKGDVTVVEFFDYHCGYCKHFFPILTQLLEQDKNVRIVFKEFPILSEDSALASKAALAVNNIDPQKYMAFHAALMKSSGRFSMEILTEKAKEAGISEEAFKKALNNPELDKEIDHNRDLAQSLNIAGTPALIIGTELVPGAVEIETLKSKVAQARNAAKEKRS